MKAKLFLLAALLAATTVNADTAKEVNADTAKEVAAKKVVVDYLNDIVRDFKECKNYKVNESYAQYYGANPSLEKDLKSFCTELLETYKECKKTDGTWKNPKASLISIFYESKLQQTLKKLFLEKGSAIGAPCVFK